MSIEYALERLVPELALAVDGDPATPVPSAAAIGGTDAAAPSALDNEAQAAADAWSAVFDSTVAFDDKAEHLDDAAALQATVESYAAAGSAMGGISLDPTDVVIEGDSATITYDVLFGGTAAYTAQTGTLTRIDGVWRVAKAEFCSFMRPPATRAPPDRPRSSSIKQGENHVCRQDQRHRGAGRHGIRVGASLRRASAGGRDHSDAFRQGHARAESTDGRPIAAHPSLLQFEVVLQVAVGAVSRP